MYSHNTDDGGAESALQVGSHRLRLLGQLEEHRARYPLLGHQEPLALHEPKELLSRLRTLGAIDYHRCILAINAPLLIIALSTQADNDNVTQSPGCVGAAIDHDYRTVHQLLGIISTLSLNEQDFLERNAVWWTCNYTGKTGHSHVYDEAH